MLIGVMDDDRVELIECFDFVIGDWIGMFDVIGCDDWGVLVGWWC